MIMSTGNDKPLITKEKLVDDLRNLGIENGTLLHLKVSLSSLGFVEGGAETVVEALLEAVGEKGTIVSDAFLDVYPLPLSRKAGKIISDLDTPSYAGALANAMVRHPKMERSRHPVQRYAAIGAQAKELMHAHTPDKNPYEPLRVMSEIGGWNLKLGSDEKVVGVGTTHVAIQLMGFKQKRSRAGINYRDENGEVKTFERNWAGGCDIGFANFLPMYHENGGVLSEGTVGEAYAKLTDMKKTLEIEMREMKKNPASFLCDRPHCRQCRTTWEFSYGEYVPRPEDQAGTPSIFKRAVGKVKRMVK